MSETPQIRIALSESKGAFPGGPQPLSDGSVVHTEAWGSTCPGCERVPAAGEQITKIFHTWWHANCGATYLRSTAADEAWLALAHQQERSPSKFNNAEIKAITRNLLRIAGRSFTIPEQGYGDTVRGSRAVLSAVTDTVDRKFRDIVNADFGLSPLYRACVQTEQTNPDARPAVIGLKAWHQLDDEQREECFIDLLQAYVELMRIERTEDQQFS